MAQVAARGLILAAMLLALLLACSTVVVTGETGIPGSKGDDSTPADDSTPVDSGPLSQSLLLEGPGAFDPVLTGPITLTLSGGEEAMVRAELRDHTGYLLRTLADGTGPVTTLSWDGTDPNGHLVDAGQFTVKIHAEREGYEDADAELSFWMVRLGMDEGTLGGEDRIPLIWHDNGGSGRYFVSETTDPTFVLSALVADDGTATTIPTPWDDLDSPPSTAVDQNMPAAYPYDAKPTLTLHFGGSVGGAPVTVGLDGWTASSDAVTDDGDVVFTRDTALAAGPGVVEETATLTWLVDGEPFATVDVPLRLYALLGPPTFDDGDSPYYPWVAVIDPALRDMDGVAATDEAVISALVDYIFNDLGIEYDTRYGASAYMSYRGYSWDSASFDMSAFLDRSNGDIVNCSDCAGILSVHANMLGAYLGQSIISPSFQLNYILAIGGDEFTHCPFGSYGCGFSYHAVTSPDSDATIYDATLALDGDDDPGSTPNEVLMVQAITGDEYMDRLVMSGSPSYSAYGTGSVQ